MNITVDFQKMDLRGHLRTDMPAGVEICPGDRVMAVDKAGNRCEATVIEVSDTVLLDVEYEKYKGV
jgi:hypothetical protein